MARERALKGNQSPKRTFPLPFVDTSLTETAAVEIFETERWPLQPWCARCDSIHVYKMFRKDGVTRERFFRWRCRTCRAQFSARMGTPFEGSRISMARTMNALRIYRQHAGKIPMLRVQRALGVSYKSMLHLLRRIQDWTGVEVTSWPFYCHACHRLFKSKARLQLKCDKCNLASADYRSMRARRAASGLSPEEKDWYRGEDIRKEVARMANHAQ